VIQTCPEYTNLLATIFETVRSKSASLSIIRGFLPPSSIIQGTRFLAAAAETSLPFSEDPVKQIMSNFYSLSVRETSGPPWRTLKQVGSRYFVNRSCITYDEYGDSSEGFTITQFPAAIA